MTAEAEKQHGLANGRASDFCLPNRKKFPPISNSDALSDLGGPSNFDSNFTRKLSSQQFYEMWV